MRGIVIKRSRQNKNGFSPLPMQYLGSKFRIAEWIIDKINEEETYEVIIDCMAGTGAVSIAAQNKGLRIVANDIQPYSYSINASIFSSPSAHIRDIIKSILTRFDDQYLLSGDRSRFRNIFNEEQKFFSSKKTLKDYKFFCEDVVSRLVSNKDDTGGNYDLFVSYYANTYFGVKQCLQIDALREFADTLDDDLKNHVLASTISAMTYAVSSTTHLAQYQRPNSVEQSRKLLKRRSMDMIDLVLERLQKLETRALSAKEAVVLNTDYLESIVKTNTSKRTVVYADPPYFKEHYSRYYHALDTFYLYDYPELTFNKRIAATTEGRYRENRIVSKFGLKSKVSEAFDELFAQSEIKGFDVAVSYANTSLVNKETIKAIGKLHNYTSKEHSKELHHSGQGQPRNRYATEYLLLFKVKNQ